jgi:PAS domain S-box-containing protein
MAEQEVDLDISEVSNPTFDEAVNVLQRLANAAFPVDAGRDAGTGLETDEVGETFLAGLAKKSIQHDATLRWTEETYRGLLEALPDALVIVGSDGRIVLVNSQTEKLFGYRREELLHQPIERLVPEAARREHVSKRDAYFGDPHVRPMGAGIDLHGRRKDGSEFPVEISLSPLRTETGLHVISTIRDISEKKRLEARYRTLVEEIPAVTFMASLDGGVSELYVSPQIEELLGFTQQEWVEDPILWYTQLHEDDRVRWHQEFARTLNLAECFQSVYRFRARDGRVVWVHGEAKVGRDNDGHPLFLQGVAFDITDRKEAEEALRHARDELEVKVQNRTAQIQASLQEKEVLLKEIHHRVKNNLQLISSMMRLQSGTIADPNMLSVFKESQDRVKTMARIHEELYRSKDLARIDFANYIQGLATNLVRSFGSGIKLTVDIKDIYFGIDTAIPCGLIINELVSNCLKYAFQEEKQGEIEIGLRTGGDDQFTLSVRDNGVGIPADLDFQNTNSLGLKLVNTLAKQLKGTIQLDRDSGTAFAITFTATINEVK